MFSFSTSILSVKCDGNNVLNWGQTSHIDTIKIFRAEKSEKQAKWDLGKSWYDI